MDARRSQVYNALFEWRGDALVRLCEDRAISLEDLAAHLNASGSPCLLVGDGVAVCKESGLFQDCRTPPELLRYQTAYGVALAAMQKEPIPAAALEPSYLRPSQAERERKAMSNGNSHQCIPSA
jgi:tRNA threonylcarbamoyladenosine biosynthesis protein TsaB